MALTESISGVASGALNVVILIVFMLVVLAVVAAVILLVFKYRKYSEYDCVIFEKDGFGNLRYKTDKAGIFVDGKTKNKRLFLKKNNVGLDPDNVPYIGGSKSKKVYLFQNGLKNFRYIYMNICGDFGFSVGEEDVNWAVNAYDRQKKMFQNTLLMQLLPFLVIAFVSIIILIMIIYILKDFNVLKDVAINLREATQIMRGGAVIT